MSFNKMSSSEVKGFFTGIILGDGFIDSGVTKRSLRIKSINIDFIDFIKTKVAEATPFKYFVKSFPAIAPRKAYKEFVIKANPYFAKKYPHFYGDTRNRVVSKQALTWLNPIGLACWFQSDGYVTLVGKTKGKIVDRRVEFSTDRYTKQTVLNLIDMLYSLFGIKSSIVTRGGVYRIRIKCESYELFFNTIKPHMVKSFYYKMNLAYSNKPKWMTDEFWDFQNTLSECDNPYIKG